MAGKSPTTPKTVVWWGGGSWWSALLGFSFYRFFRSPFISSRPFSRLSNESLHNYNASYCYTADVVLPLLYHYVIHAAHACRATIMERTRVFLYNYNQLRHGFGTPLRPYIIYMYVYRYSNRTSGRATAKTDSTQTIPRPEVHTTHTRHSHRRRC